MPRWAMLADDLTGACDAGVAFAVAGLSTRVTWREPASWPPAPSVLAISTETRSAEPSEAAAKVRRICQRLDRTIVYKKIDSALRGPLAAEIQAVHEACGFKRTLVCPALPEQERFVRDSRLYIHGEPVEAPAGVELTDAETEHDLRLLARELAREIGVSLAAGSAGLAFALARELGRAGPTEAPPRCSKPVAVVVGSHHEATLAQLDYLRRAGGVFETTAEGFETVESDVFAAIVMRKVDETAFEPLGRALQAGRFGGLVATGGATARVMLDGLAAEGIELRGELERGVPWGVVRGGAADGAPILTKSGGFGAEDCLWRAWRALRREEATA